MNSNSREVVEGAQIQGEDERIVYTLDVSHWGSSPTEIIMVAKNEVEEDVTVDVTALVMASRARHSNVATITTDAAHGLTTGNRVTVFDCEDIAYNAENVAVTVTSPTEFTYANAGDDESTTVDTDGRVATPTSAVATSPTTTTIQLPRILRLIKEREYRVEIKFKMAGNTLEAYFIILGEM